MADYGVNIKVAVQGQQNARQLGEQIREIVNGLEAADKAFTRFSNNLKSFDQRRTQRKVNEELDKTAQKYRELDRLQRQLLANDNSAIKAAERRAKLEEHISKNISAGRLRRQSARQQFLAGDPGQYATTIGPQPDRIGQIRKIAAAEEQAARQVAGIRNQLFRDLNRTQIDLLQEKIRREMDAQQQTFNNAIRLNKKEVDDFDRRLAESIRNRSEAAKLTNQTSPIGGAVGIPGSPAALAAEERARKFKSAQGSALIGGAFPLLFGQGIGAAAGGAVGGFGGGIIGGEFGFGLSLIGTQVGTLIDQFVAGATELGQALNPLTADIDALTNAAGLAATETQKLIKQIEEEAGEKAALAAATSELALIVGTDGVTALTEFGDGSLELSRQFSIAMTQMQSVLAKFLNSIGLGKGLAGAVERTNLLRAGLANTTDPELLRLQKERRQALTGAAGAVAGAATIGIDKEIIERQAQLQKENSKELKEQARLAAQNNDQGLRQAGILRDRLTVERLGSSLLDDRVYKLERSIIFQEAALKAAKDGLTPLEEANIFRERDVELMQLANRRQAEAERIANRKLRLSEKDQKAIERKIKAADREIERTAKAFEQADSQLDDIINKNKDKVAFEREYAELIRSGSTPAAAKQAIELKKQQLELDRNFEKLTKQLDLQVAVAEAAILEAKARGASGDELDRLNQDLADILEKIGKLPGKKEDAEGVIIEALAPKSDRDRLQAYLDTIQGRLNDLMDPVRQITSLADTLGGAFTESFKGIISGSMTAREALANLFQRTADHFLDMAAQMIAAQIKMQVVGLFMNFLNPYGSMMAPGGRYEGQPGPLAPTPPPLPPLPPKALGGAVGAGQPYLVGEKGPELFVPGAQGNIVPNSGMGGSNIVVNVDASGSSVEGDAQEQKALGAAIGAAVQAELIKQKRPGGLLF